MRKINKYGIFKNGISFTNIISSRALSNGVSISFEELFGDLSDCIFMGDLNLGDLNLNSLKGCPKKIEDGFFSIENNPELKTLDYFPIELDAGNTIFVDCSLIELFLKLDISTYKDLYLYLAGNKLSNKEIAVQLSKMRKARGSFNFIHKGSFKSSSKALPEIEKFYKLYEKVSFNKEKFDRLLELL